MKAVILAGGLGTRLKPFTQVIPKPLLPVGESSVLEIQIMSLKACGFTDVYIATNFKSDYVEAFLQSGDRYGLQIHFSREEEPLGTCGPLSLLKDDLDEPFVLMNGDILTTLKFDEALAFGKAIESDLTIITKEISAPFHFGKITASGNYITDIEEKPDLKFEILAGIYVIKPELLQHIPENAAYGIDELIKDMLARGDKVAKFLNCEYWLDIGQMHDYETAQQAYEQHFSALRDAKGWATRTSDDNPLRAAASTRYSSKATK
ncbi:MAG: sugar phosphate nucleotidyltransferase [Planctomycetota bacterium]